MTRHFGRLFDPAERGRSIVAVEGGRFAAATFACGELAFAGGELVFAGEPVR